MVKNRDNTYGLGLFERVLIMTLVIIFLVGVASIMGQPLGGVVLSLFIMGVFITIGFIPFWIVALSLVSGYFILLWRSGGQ